MSGGPSLLLGGLRGDNPLAYLAAIGTLRTLHSVWPGRPIRLSWAGTDGAWRPAVRGVGVCDRDRVIDRLVEALGAAGQDLPGWQKDMPIPVGDFRAAVRNALQAPAARRAPLDLLASLGSDLPAEAGGDSTAVTLFKMVSGQQSFLGQMRELVRETGRAHLEEALFGTWAYRDPKPSMRWDPADDRRYALRASDPSDTGKSPILTVRGANRLAIEALALYPVIPTARGAMTRGFVRGRSRWVLTWPVWKGAAGLDAVRSLVSHPELAAAEPSPDRLRPLGVAEVFRSERTTSYYSNFYPARALWGQAT